jgi:hypothetical protein
LKTGGGSKPLVGSSPTASASGSWSNRTTPAPQTGNPGAIPGDSTRDGPVVQRPRRLAYTQETMVQLHPGLLDRPGTPMGRAAWLKPRRLPVRFQPWARPGRQAEDHLGLEPGMLRVRIPPGPLETSCPRGAAWSARLPVTQEIAGSNPVEGAYGAVRKAEKRPSSNLGDCGFDSRLRHLRVVLLTAACKAVVAKEVRWMTRGSIPSQPTDGPFAYRHRMPASQAGGAGSIPARATEHDQVAQLVDARRSERRAARHGSSTLPLVTHCRRGRCPTGFHTAGALGSIPGPATAGGPVPSRAS